MLYYLSLGANISPRHDHIDAACALLEQRCGHILRRSADFLSQAWGYHSPNEYLNICVAVLSDLLPDDFLRVTQQIERELGRTHKTDTSLPLSRRNYQDRTIDIDLILVYPSFDEPSLIYSSPFLTLPHPLYTQRDFVLNPLREIHHNPALLP